MTGYVVHYSDGDTDRTESVPASSTSSLITGLTNGLNYTFSVEAASEHLFGRSIHCMIMLGMSDNLPFHSVVSAIMHRSSIVTISHSGL